MTGHVVLALDKFKGSISAADASRALAEGMARTSPDTGVLHLPVADGGDGSLDALLAIGYQPVHVEVHGPLAERRKARTAVRRHEAFVELAEVCGIRWLPEGQLHPWRASSLGLGEAIRMALDAGARSVRVGLGGSASTDGGIGMLQALGARVYDDSGQPCTPDAHGMAAARRLDLSGLNPHLRSTTVVAVTDVESPLTGPTGAAQVFGPQKGLQAADVMRLDAALEQWGQLLETTTGRSVEVKGAGAAGGIGAAVVSALGGSITPGASYILDAVQLDASMSGASLVVTGEGSWDTQTAMGKAPHEVLRRATNMGVPVAVVAGRIDPSVRFGPNVAAAYSLLDLQPDSAVSIADPAPLLVQIGALLGTRVRDNAEGTTRA